VGNIEEATGKELKFWISFGGVFEVLTLDGCATLL
jgi:hypothetical protein